MQGLSGAGDRHVEQAGALVGGAHCGQSLEIGAQLPALFVAYRGHRGHDEIARALVAWQIEPTQQRLCTAIELAVQTRDEHVIELESLGAMNGHDLHRVRKARLRFRVELRAQSVDVLRTAPLSARYARAQRLEERARVQQLAARVGVHCTEAHPHALQPLNQRQSIARTQPYGQYLADA